MSMDSILFLVLSFSILISYFLNPLILKYGRKLSILDKPDFRKEHRKPVVRLGGILIYLGFIIPVLLILYLNSFENELISTFKVFNFHFFYFFYLAY